MKNKCAIALIITGAMLIISALLLCLHNIIEDKNSGETANKILNELKQSIENNNSRTTQPETDLFSRYEPTKADEITVDNEEYIGYITIPSINIQLPVMNNWDYNKLNSSPCRYSGSVSDNNLVIAAHNYSSHFRNIDNLSSEDLIYFTDTSDVTYEYKVTNIEVLKGTDIDAMTDKTVSNWDITLFTCNFDGRNRITVRAEKNS